MSSKQDLAAARTPGDIERKYNFGKTFAEVFGMAEDAQKAAEKAQQAADNATDAVGDLDQDTIFNLLTNNGELKGLFMKDGELYMNASYLKSGEVNADLIKVGSIKSADGKTCIDLDSGIAHFFDGIITNGFKVRSKETDEVNLFEGKTVENHISGLPVYQMTIRNTAGAELVHIAETYNGIDGSAAGGIIRLVSPNSKYDMSLHVTDSFAEISLLKDGSGSNAVRISEDGNVCLGADKLNEKNISWKDNGDGTYTLIGR